MAVTAIPQTHQLHAYVGRSNIERMKLWHFSGGIASPLDLDQISRMEIQLKPTEGGTITVNSQTHPTVFNFQEAGVVELSLGKISALQSLTEPTVYQTKVIVYDHTVNVNGLVIVDHAEDVATDTWIVTAIP